MIRRALKIALLIAGALLLLLVAAEVAASFTPSGNASLFIEDPDMYLVRKPDNDGFTWGNGRWIACHINKEGLRGEDLPEVRDPAEKRVLCIGDSFTFGGGVETDEAWPQQLQAVLGAPGQSGLRILNGGANGWFTLWHRLYLEKRALKQFEPDLVVLGWNWNDLNTDEGGPDQAVRFFIHAEGSWLAPFARFAFLRDTHLYRWLYSREKSSAGPPGDEVLRRMAETYRATIENIAIAPERKFESRRRNSFGRRPPDMAFWEMTDTPNWKVVRKELALIKELCDSHGTVFVVAMLPEPTWTGPGTFPGVERLAALLDQLGVPWVDVQPEVLKRAPDGTLQGQQPGIWQRYDPVHPTPAGQRIIAEDVAKLLREKGLLAPKAR